MNAIGLINQISFGIRFQGSENTKCFLGSFEKMSIHRSMFKKENKSNVEVGLDLVVVLVSGYMIPMIRKQEDPLLAEELLR